MCLRDILSRVKNGDMDLIEAEKQIRLYGYQSVGKIAKLDACRMARIGVPEVILAEGKNAEDLMDIAMAQLKSEGRAIITRVSDEQLGALRKASKVEWHPHARVAILRKKKKSSTDGVVGIIAAGTADIPVAEEARIIAEEMGCKVITAYDVGVAGIHRLFSELSKMIDAGVDALVVAAGREGALPAVVAGLVDVPVIGLPVSTGYGAGGSGEAALLSMLQSCSVLSVVNIDAGFVAGAFAAKIANKAREDKK
ncbi:MAG: nickel pincer cofactor biosynthesis protein LarB [Methanocellales archaeon]|nr:nickel pincer cofactor biosynthesis protein LarB [Methanocellales archaeon]